MRKTLTFAAIAAMNTALLAGPALAQGAPQNVSLVKVDVTKLATGFRASKVIGSTVVNDHDDTVGKVDDIIVSPDGKAPFVVLSVGGFLGMGTHYVVLPYESLKMNEDKITLPGATKDALKKLPEFNYAK